MSVETIATCFVAVGLTALAAVPYVFAQREEKRARRHRESTVNSPEGNPVTLS